MADDKLIIHLRDKRASKRPLVHARRP